MLTQSDTDFQPGERQLAYLAACLDPHVTPSVEARCVSAGISRDTYYRWLRDAGFREWLARERRRALGAVIQDVIDAAVREAKRGSLEHIRLVLEVAGVISPDRRRAGHTPAPQLVVNVPRPSTG